MNRRTFFRRTVGALATAAIAPRLLASEPVWYGVDYGAGEPIIGVALTSARAGEIVTIRLVQQWTAFDWRCLAPESMQVGDDVTNGPRRATAGRG